MTSNGLKQGLLLGVAFACLAATAARAETATAAVDAAAPAAASNTAVDEVVVTGTLRSQKLQDAPIAVTSISQDTFEKSGFKELKELTYLSTSIQITQGANGIYIRGSGTNSQNVGTEQSVGMVIDGVLMGFVDDIGGDISDLDHIEIYRGPQGTQFAKNASAGVVSVTTKRPEIGLYTGSMHATIGEHRDSDDNVMVNLPINDTMAARFVTSFQHRDGVFPNVARGDTDGSREQYGLKGKFLWSPRDRASVYISADYRREAQDPNFPQAWRSCGPGSTTTFVTVFGSKALPGCLGALGYGVVPSPTNTKIVELDDAFRHTRAGGVSGQVDWPLGDFELTSISAFRFLTREFHGPSGSGTFSNSFINNNNKSVQYSEEFRIASPGGKKLTYVGGLFLYDRETDLYNLGDGRNYGSIVNNLTGTDANGQTAAQIGPTALQATNGGALLTHNGNKSIAVFADGSYHFTDKLQFNLGMRVTHDDVNANGHIVKVVGVVNNGTPRISNADSMQATAFTYRVGPQYFFTPDLQVFFSASSGYKGPIVDTSTNIFGRVLPETVNALELGEKSSWFDHRVTANFTLFREQFKNYQVSTLNLTVVPNVFQLGNAGGELSQGAELEFTGRATHDLTLTTNVTYLDSHYTDFTTSCYTTPAQLPTSTQIYKQPQTTAGPIPGACYQFTSGTGVVRTTQAGGFPLINSSRWTYRIGASYKHDLPKGYVLDATAGYLWRSGFYSVAPDPNTLNSPYGIANFNLGVSTPDGRMRVGLFVRNAFNQFFTLNIQPNTSDGGAGGATNVLPTEAVRTIGVSLNAKF